MKRFLFLTALFGMLVSLSGCATVGISLLGAGAGMVADRGIDHILKSTVNKTFPVPLEEVRIATLQSLDNMELTVEALEPTDFGYVVTGRAKDRLVEVELNQLSPRVTRMQVDVKRNFFRRDRATAEAIVEQTEWTLSQIKLASQNNSLGRTRAHVPTAEILRASYYPDRRRPATPRLANPALPIRPVSMTLPQ